MADIYTNAFFDSPELNSENFTETVENYIDRLEKTTKEYKNLLKFIKAKKIKILKAKGFPYAGSFSVDEIDTARLKKEGFVIDMVKNPNEENPTFYIDEDLDEELKNLDIASDQMPIIQEILNSEHAPPAIVDMSEDDIEEKSSLINLAEVFSQADKPELAQDEEEEFTPGTLVVDVRQVGDHQYSFNLTVADLNDDPLDVKFNREKAQFEYKCGACDEMHVESITSVFRSLKTTSALMSNLIAMVKQPKELAVALEFIDHDLRLLQSLVAFDYALSDDEGVVGDDDDEDDEEFESDSDDGDCDDDCDHDHDEEDEFEDDDVIEDDET